jgi:hypothetical protein
VHLTVSDSPNPSGRSLISSGAGFLTCLRIPPYTPRDITDNGQRPCCSSRGLFLAFESLKREIGAARTRAALVVNHELIALYWRIEREILARQELEGWGARIIDRLALDLGQAFPGMKGLSRSDVYYMRQSRLPGQIEKLSNESLDNCPGATTSSSSASRRTTCGARHHGPHTPAMHS